ncbi:Uncharacterised protein [Vibrio cholerae]|nr:Uncharacterised protein [Vibrio cholerae]
MCNAVTIYKLVTIGSTKLVIRNKDLVSVVKLASR